MKHIVFFIHVISFMFGCVTIVLSILSYLKYNSRLIKYFTLFLISMLAILMERTIMYYQLVSVLDGEYLSVILWVISCLGSGLLMYSLPLFTYELLQLNLSEGKKLIFSLLAFLPIISLVLYYTLPYKIIILNVINLIIFITLLYCLCLGVILMKSVKLPATRKIIKTFLIIFGFWIPLMFIDFRLQEVPVFQNTFPYGLLSLPIFYFVWNFFSLYFGFNYLDNFVHSLVEKEQKDGFEETLEEDKLENAFFERYKFTNREREVIQLLVKGYSYKMISEELVISFTTARTHGYNIYQKAGVRNKIELINLMKQNH
ncbi:MAG: helix-turn-helix transcriptional regulator [Anaerosolibacter sp.]|nr:helix-turn-helix transcriptional regulator [Anaerosolibacter sp.]